MKRQIRKVTTLIGNIIFVILLLCLFQTVYSIQKDKTVSFFDYHILRVLSNSMEPNIKVNTCIIVKETDADDIKVGDVITFRSMETEIYGEYNSHRVYKIVSNSKTGEKEFITKGDAFEYPDRLPVTEENILGKMDGKIPFSDKWNVFLQKLANNKVYFVIIILPLILCLISYIYQLGRLIVYGPENERKWQKDETHREL